MPAPSAMPGPIPLRLQAGFAGRHRVEHLGELRPAATRSGESSPRRSAGMRGGAATTEPALRPSWPCSGCASRGSRSSPCRSHSSALSASRSCSRRSMRATPEEQKVESRSVRAPPRAARQALFGPSTPPALPPDDCRWPPFVRNTVRLLPLIAQKGRFGLCDAGTHAYTLT